MKRSRDEVGLWGFKAISEPHNALQRYLFVHNPIIKMFQRTFNEFPLKQTNEKIFTTVLGNLQSSDENWNIAVRKH